MSRAAASSEQSKSLLPLPEIAVSHHLKTLQGPMKEWRSKKRVPPVLLLTGIPGVGKRSMAWHLSQWILCEKSGLQSLPSQEDAQDSFFGMGALEQTPATEIDPDSEPKPCGECSNCMKALHGTWVDFTEIQPENSESEGSGALKIEQFRKLKSSMGFGGHDSDYRVVLIPDADRMTVQAANSVLKLLEEPPAGWIFLLTAGDATLLLPTIVSRCQTIRLKPFVRESIEALLRIQSQGIDERKIPICAELAQGSWGKALAWTQSETWEKRKLVVDFIADPKAQLNALVDWASLEPRNMDRMIDQLESLTSDLIRWSLSGINPSSPPGNPEHYRWVNSDAKSALIQNARVALKNGNERTRALWLSRAERFARARLELQAPLNRKLLAQDLLIPWLT